MPEVYAYFTTVDQTDEFGDEEASESIPWEDTDNVIDATSSTYTTVTLDTTAFVGVSYNLTVDDVYLDSTSDLYISKVEIGINHFENSLAEEIFFGGDYFEDRFLIIYPFSTVGPSYANIGVDLRLTDSSPEYIDITDIAGMPGTGNWTWEHIENMSIDAFAYIISLDSTAEQTFQVSIDNIFLRITTNNDPGNFGLQCWDSTGNIILDTGDRISRVLYSTIAKAYEDGDDTFEVAPGGSDRSYAFSLPINATDGQLPHSVEISGNTISWTENSKDGSLAGNDFEAYGSCDSLIVVIGW